MPIAPTYPGVYIEELPSGVRTITGVSTSVTAFLGSFSRGQLNTPVQVFGVADLERNFGPLVSTSEAGYSIRQFFTNGGSEAWVVRVASGAPVGAAISMKDQVSGGAAVLRADAYSEGIWGNNVRLDVDHETAAANLFNLTVREVDGQNRTLVSETHRNLSLDPASPSFAEDVVNASSQLVKLTRLTNSATARPAMTGTTTSAPITDAGANGLASTKTLQVVVNGTNVGGTFTLGSTDHATVLQLANLLQARIRAADPSLQDLTVSAVRNGSNQFLRVGSPRAGDLITFGGTLATDINIDSANVQAYSLGGAASAAQVLPGGTLTAGADGGAPDAAALIGSPIARTGIYALEDVDIFNILCLPDVANLSDTNASGVITTAETYCAGRRAFFILDVPQSPAPRDDVAEIKGWLDQNATLRHRNAALYFPRPRIPDPLNGFRLRTVRRRAGRSPASMRAPTPTRGVWKAPAGTEAALRGVAGLDVQADRRARTACSTRSAINCLRTFPVFGNVVLGRAHAATAPTSWPSSGSTSRSGGLALFIEESLFRGHEVGRLRAERRAAVGADPAERRRVHARPVPAGRVPGHDARATPTS